MLILLVICIFLPVTINAQKWDWSLLNKMHEGWTGLLPHQTLCRAPDTSRVRSKMLYASSKDRFKRELDGIQVELQATDPSEMSMDIVKARALWNSPRAAPSRSASAPALACYSFCVGDGHPFSCHCFPGRKSVAFCMRLYAILPFYRLCRSPATAVN